MIRVTWTPSDEPGVINVGHYDLRSAPDVAGAPGAWSALATVHDVRPGPAYCGGLFAFDHEAGVETTWYTVRTVDQLGEASPWSAPFQPGVPRSPPSEYTSEALVESVKRRASIPVSQSTFTDEDILELANEEVLSTLVPLIMGASEDYLLTSQDLPLESGRAYRIPARAVGSTLHSAAVVTSSGEEVPLPRVRPERNPSFGFSIRSGFIVPVVKTGTAFPTLRLRYALRPARLVPSDSVGYVSGVDWAAGKVSLGLVPAAFASRMAFDLVKSSPPFDSILLEQTCRFDGDVVVFPGSLPEAVDAGDLVCLSGQANVVQLPVEWFPVLAQLVAVRCLKALGDLAGAREAEAEAERLKVAALRLVSQRVEGNVELIAPAASSPWRTR